MRCQEDTEVGLSLVFLTLGDTWRVHDQRRDMECTSYQVIWARFTRQEKLALSGDGFSFKHQTDTTIVT